jgi:hypothetical protein
MQCMQNERPRHQIKINLRIHRTLQNNPQRRFGIKRDIVLDTGQILTQ